MEVRVERFDDRSEPYEHGLYEYIHVGFNLHFRTGSETLTFRLHDDDPGVATLVAPPAWRRDIYFGALFRSATDCVREHNGARSIHVHDPAGGGFKPLKDAVRTADQLGLDGDDDVDS